MATTFSFRAAHGRQVDAGLGERDAPLTEVFGFGDALGHVQEALRGDAASEQADTAQPRFEIDQSDLQAEIGGEKRGRVSTGAGAEDAELGLHGEKGIRD